MDRVKIRQMQTKQMEKSSQVWLYKGQTKWNLGPKALEVIRQDISYKN